MNTDFNRPNEMRRRDGDFSKSSLYDRVMGKELSPNQVRSKDQLKFVSKIDDLDYRFDLNNLSKDYELRTSDTLYNDDAFRNYWKNRKKDNSSIKYAEVSDIDGDGNDDNVAYYVDEGGKKHLLGFNQYYLTPKGESEAAYKHEYYSVDPKTRKRMGLNYSQYMRDTAEYKAGYLSNEDFLDRRTKAKSKPVYLLIRLLKRDGRLNTLSVETQMKLGNFWFKCIKEAFFEEGIQTAIKNYIKGKGGLGPYYKDFVINLYNAYIEDPDFLRNVKEIFDLCREEDSDILTKIMRAETKASGYILSKNDTYKLYTKLIQSKEKVKEDIEAKDEAYLLEKGAEYGYNPYGHTDKTRYTNNANFTRFGKNINPRYNSQ